MARLPRLFRVPRIRPLAVELRKFRVIFFVILKMVYYVYSLESPQRGDSNEKTKHTLMFKRIEKNPVTPTVLEI